MSDTSYAQLPAILDFGGSLIMPKTSVRHVGSKKSKNPGNEVMTEFLKVIPPK